MFYRRRFQSTGLLGQRKHVTNQSSTYVHGGQLVTIASAARMIANARTDSASARAPSLQNGRGALLTSRVGITVASADSMPSREARVAGR